MKFKNIKVGMKIQNKESGLLYEVISQTESKCFILDHEFYDEYYGCMMKIMNKDDVHLFRKHKGEVK